MPQTKVLIASVLKPVDDVRHYRKLARTLASANKYQIFIIGKGSQKKSPEQNIQFLATGQFARISLKRLFVQWHFLKRILEIKPELVLITTPELLPIAALLKGHNKFKLVYDVQEDYSTNFSFQAEYSALMKIVFKVLLKLTNFGLRKVDHFLLAEKIYGTTLTLPKDKITVLENKFLMEYQVTKSTMRKAENGRLDMIISGTLSPYTNPLLGIQFYKKLKQVLPTVRLKIVGKVLNKNYQTLIESACVEEPEIELILDQDEVNYDTILNHLTQSNLGILCYETNPVNEFRIPTKLYEFAALQIPYFVQKGSHWDTVGERMGGAIGVDFHAPDLVRIKDLLLNPVELFKNTSPEPACWTEEGELLLAQIDRLSIST